MPWTRYASPFASTCSTWRWPRGPAVPTEIDLDPGVTLLAAKVLRLPIILAEAAVPSLEADDRTDLPPVFRELLASLDLREDVPPDHHSA